jgi:universal stress protein A
MNGPNQGKACGRSVLQELESQLRELHAWGHFFNAEGMSANNHGQPSEQERSCDTGFLPLPSRLTKSRQAAGQRNKKGIMKIKPTSKKGGVLVELRSQETQIPQMPLAAPSVRLPVPFSLKRILVPMDFSECSRKALLYAVPFAKQFNAELILLHVVEPYPAVPELTTFEVETLNDGRRELEAACRAVSGEVPAHGELRNGLARLEIANAARELGIDLIVLSTHGRKGLSRMLLGSTAEMVVRHAPCPVLIVRENEREFLSDTPFLSQRNESHSV